MGAISILIGIGLLWISWKFLRAYFGSSPLDNVPGPKSPSFFSGHVEKLFNRHRAWEFHKELSENYGPVVKIQEMFGKRALYVYDPAAMHSIVVKDQYVIHRLKCIGSVNQLIVGPNILAAVGDEHRAQRKMLNPVFSIAHMRYLTPLFYDTMHKMQRAITKQVRDGPTEVDIHTWMGRAALELIGQGGLGYSFDPLEDEMQDDYGLAIKGLQPALAKTMTYMMLTPYLRYLPSGTWNFIGKYFPDPNLRLLKKTADTMFQSSLSIYRAKKEAFIRGDEAVQEQIGQGKDIMSVLLKANMEAAEEDRLSEEVVIAQMSTFVIAGMDTTTTSLARTLHLLALRQDVQEKLRDEILAARKNGDPSFDELMDLPYLDAICRETLRLYAPVPLIARENLQDIVMPLSNPIRGVDGKLMNEVFVPKGTMILVSNWMSNVNKAIWGEDADQWKPERWLSPLPDAVKEARIPGIYANLMTFIGGGRACIGFKFSQLEMKVVLSVLLAAFKFRTTDKHVNWNVGNITYPTVGDDEDTPSLPLIVEAI